MKNLLIYFAVLFFSLAIVGCEDETNGSSDTRTPVAVMTKAWNVDDANVVLAGYVLYPGSNVTLVFEYGTNPQKLDKKVFADFFVRNDTAYLAASVGGLTKLTTYYVRVNAIKENLPIVSEALSFATTEFKTPLIKSINKKSITSTDITVVVKVNPSANPTKVWLNYGATKEELTQSTPVSKEVTGGADVDVEVPLSGLTASTAYYYQVVTENKGGKRYSDILRVRSNEGTVTDFDGKVYQTVKIGDQVWTSSNWACNKYADGTVIDSCFIYKNDANKLAAYGRLYSFEALKKNNIAPQGWRVPTKDDWNKLITQLGGELNAGGYLKDKSFLSIANSVVYPDIYNFSSIPTGMRNTKGIYFHEKDASVNWYSYYWGSNDMGSGEGFRVYMTYNYEGCFSGTAPAGNAYSVRLIKE